MSRWLGIDHGTKRIGAAAGDTAHGIASPLVVIPAEPEETAIHQIRELAAQYQVDGIVVGWPLNMDDSEGPQAQMCREFSQALAQASGKKVHLFDERLTSEAAEAKLLEAGLTKKKRQARTDMLAAAIILQSFLDAKNS